MDKIFNNNSNETCECDDMNTNTNNMNNNNMNNNNMNNNNMNNNNMNNNNMNNMNNNNMNNNNMNNNMNTNNNDIEMKKDNMCYVKLILSILVALAINEMIKFFINQSIRLNKGTSAKYIYYPLVCIVILIILCMR